MNSPHSRAASFLILTATALPILSCGRSVPDSKAVAAASQPVVVAVARATRENLSRDLVLTAEFRPFQEVEVMAKVAGYLKKIYVDAGDHVREGQLLATLEVPELGDEIRKANASVDRSDSEVARAKDEVTRAESSHQMTHLTYARLADVAKQRPGLVAQQEIDDAQSKDLVSEANIAAAKSSLNAALQQVAVNKADQSRAGTMNNYTQVTAPFAGVITKRYADTGSLIQAGTASQTQAMPLVRLSENSLLRLILPVPESAVSTVKVGQAVEVRVPTLNRAFPGKVARFTDKLQTSTRTMDTEVDVPNPSGVLIPGMYAEVSLTTEGRQHALVVPVGAVDTSGVALVVNSDGHVEQRRVKTGMETAERQEVLSGLREGEMVVTGNRGALQTGQVVKPRLTAMTDTDGDR